MVYHHTVPTKWQVWSYDVWGNDEDGYVVNNRFKGPIVDLSIPATLYNEGTEREFWAASPDDDQIKEALCIEDDVEIDADNSNNMVIYVTAEENGYPLGVMTCEEPNSLSPCPDPWTNYEYVIPHDLICPLEYGDYSGMTDGEIKQLKDFVEDLPPSGSWEWGDEPYFSRTNDIYDLGTDVVDAIYRVPPAQLIHK